MALNAGTGVALDAETLVALEAGSTGTGTGMVLCAEEISVGRLTQAILYLERPDLLEPVLEHQGHGSIMADPRKYRPWALHP